MNLRFSLFVTISTFLLFGSSSCNQSQEVKTSKHYESESHNNGRNCMDCHVAGRKGEGTWAIAGSCYDSLYTNPYPNATIKLFTKSNGEGTEVASIEVDGLGNFYTTETVNFGSGLYPVVIGTSGKKLSMQSTITTGACGSCHNFNTCKICVK